MFHSLLFRPSALECLHMRATDYTSAYAEGYISIHEDVAFPEALSLGWEMTWDNVGLVLNFLKQLGSGQASMRDMGGPIAITQAITIVPA